MQLPTEKKTGLQHGVLVSHFTLPYMEGWMNVRTDGQMDSDIVSEIKISHIDGLQIFLPMVLRALAFGALSSTITK